MNDQKYIYFRMDFENCPTLDFDYTIVPNLDEVHRILKVIEGDLDSNEDSNVTIIGVAMTHNEYRHWQIENKEQ